MVVDRVTLKPSSVSRVAEAVELATKLADGKVLVQVLGADGKPQGEASGASSGATGGLGEGSIFTRLPWRAPSTVIRWTSFSLVTSPLTHLMAHVLIAWVLEAAMRWTLLFSFPTLL